MKHLPELIGKLKSIPEQGVSLKTTRGYFTVTPVTANDHIVGIEVTNLGDSKFISISVFVVVLSLLALSPGRRAVNGNAITARLGDAGLALDSIEGHVANVVYGKGEGEWAFKRITPITKVLVWVGVCESVGKGPTKGLRLSD